jgi:hypothetical protein
VTAIRLSGSLRKAVDEWRRQQSDPPSRSEAIRRLIERALEREQPRRAGPNKGASKARYMAAQELDRLADTSATDEERQTRKRRILKGPEEFREVRKDIPKRKR